MFLRTVAFISLVCSLLLIATLSSAAETRGLSVVAKDKSTGRNEEVKLYNKSYAVIIGIDRYRNLSADRQLKNAVIDAKGIEATLRKLYRFDHIYTLYDQDATHAGITRLLTSELPKTMGEGDSLFVFWAGHGNQEKTHDGELGYLIPHDGNADGIYGNITMSQLKDDISRAIPAKHIFYAFDACYSGLLTSRSVDKKVSHDISYLKSITSERVRQVLTAGSKGQEALDGGPRGHSVFTGRLIEALEARGDYITANEIQQQLKEKVYHDARARGHEQTPGYGTLYGTGDYVFVPQEQKIEDGSAELERIIRERKTQEKMVAEMNKSRDADQQRRAREEQEKLKALEELEKKAKEQLTREQEEAQNLKRSQEEFSRKQNKQQEEITLKRKEEEARLAELKKIVATAPVGSTGSLDAAVTEIRRLSTEIGTIESRFKTEQAAAGKRIAERYDAALADVKLQRDNREKAPLVKGEFEKESDFSARQKNWYASFDSRIAELERQKRDELTASEQTLAQTMAERTAGLRASMQELAQREYSIDVDNIIFSIGAYDAEKEQFPVTMKGKAGTAVKLDVKSVVPVPLDSAPRFKELCLKGIVRPEVRARAGDGEVVRIALADTSVASDSGSYLLEYVDGQFLTAVIMKRDEKKHNELAEALGGELIGVKGGCYQRGDTFGDGESDEKPVHEVCVDSFRIGKYEVTQGQWEKVMGNNPSQFKKGTNYPVEQVSWDDVQQFIKKLNAKTGKRFRLPTEAEWEYAARSGGKNEKYSGGDELRSVAWYALNSGKSTHPVGTKSSNGLGIYDMSGNVKEWCQDWYGNYSSTSSRNNPQGPFSGASRVFRGGGWDDFPGIERSAKRDWLRPGGRGDGLGFRLALPAQ